MINFYRVKNLLLITIIGTNLHAAANCGAGAPEDTHVKASNTRTVPISDGLYSSAPDPHYEADARLKARQATFLAEYTPAVAYSEKDREGKLNPSALGVKVGGPEELPINHSHHVYIDGKLRKHVTAARDMDVRVYAGPDGTTDFISAGAGPKSDRTALEALGHTREDTYEGARKYPIPTYKYKHKLPTGVELSFDRGHEIDHADTKEVRGLHSTLDVDNYTPQNSYYNRNIRRPLVDHIRTERGTYKEIVIYGTNPISIVEGKDAVKLPIGFVFLEFKDHKIFKAYYFPNLIDYGAMPEDKLEHGKWKEFAKNFEIDISKIGDVGAFRPTEISKDIITSHMKQIFGNASLGFRMLSDSRRVVPKELELPKEARAALIKHIAVHHLEQAAELEFDSVEYKLAIARNFASKFKYEELDVTSDEEMNTYHKLYSEALAKKSAELGFNLAEYADSELRTIRVLANPEVTAFKTAKDPIAFAATIEDPEERKEFLQVMKWEPFAEAADAALEEVNAQVPIPERGQDIYDLEEAKYWVERAEVQVATSASTIEEKVHLLEAYKDEELRVFTTPEKIKALEDNVEAHATTSSTIDEKSQLIEYFGIFTPKGESWIKAMLDQLKAGGTSQEKVMIADRYGHFTESNLKRFSKDLLLKAKNLVELSISLYKEGLALIDKSEVERIAHCIDKNSAILKRIEDRIKA